MDSLLIPIDLADVGGQRRKVLMVYQKRLLRESACYLLHAGRTYTLDAGGPPPPPVRPANDRRLEVREASQHAVSTAPGQSREHSADSRHSYPRARRVPPRRRLTPP